MPAARFLGGDGVDEQGGVQTRDGVGVVGAGQGGVEWGAEYARLAGGGPLCTRAEGERSSRPAGSGVVLVRAASAAASVEAAAEEVTNRRRGKSRTGKKTTTKKKEPVTVMLWQVGNISLQKQAKAGA